MGLRALASTCLLLAGCSFDASLPPGAMPRCQSDRDCPPPLVCTPLDEAERFCLPPGEEFPDVVASSVEAAIVPGPGSLLERPSVLGPRSDLALRFGTTEPLAEAPEVSAPLLGCAAITAESTSFEVRCVVRADVVEPGAEVTFEVSLVDRSGLRARRALPGVRVRVDTVTPTPPREADGGVARVRAPWGTAEDPTPLDALTVGAGSVEPGAFLAARDLSGGLVALVKSAADGSLAAAPLERGPDAVEVAAVDEAGNASGWVPVTSGVWIAALHGRRPGSDVENPHRFGFVGAQGAWPERRDLEERGAPSGEAFSGAAVWRHGGARLPRTFGRPSLAYVPSLSGTVRLGGIALSVVDVLGVERQVGPPLGLSGTFRFGPAGWALTDLADPEIDGDPPGRVNAVAAWDRLQQRLLVQGGNGPSDRLDGGDPADGPLLSDTWALSAGSWRRLPPGPARRGAVGWVEPFTGAFVVAGGEADGGLPTALARFSEGAWRADAGALPEGRAFAALLQDPRVPGVALFGGELPDGGVSGALLVSSTDGGFEVRAVAGPAPRSRAASTWDTVRGRGVLYGGRLADGTWADDAWWYDGAQWHPLGWETPGAGLEHPSLAFDPERDVFVLLAGQRTFEWSGADGGLVERTATHAPGAAYHPPLACGRGLAGCVLFDGQPLRAFRWTGAGWSAAVDLVPDGGRVPLPQGSPGVIATTWSDSRGQLLAVDPQLRATTWSPDVGWRTDGGVPANPCDGRPVRGGSCSRAGALVEGPDGPVLVTTPHGRTFRWAGAWSPPGQPLLTVPFTDVELNWVGLAGSSRGLSAFGLQLTRRPRLPLAPAGLCWPEWGAPPLTCANFEPKCAATLNAMCAAPEAVPTFSQRWRQRPDGGWDPGGQLLDVGALGALSLDPVRDETLWFGGMDVGSDVPTARLQRIGPDGAAAVVTVSDGAGDGAPRGRIAASMGYDWVHRVHVLQGGASSATKWGLWQTRTADITAASLSGVNLLTFLNDTQLESWWDYQVPTADLTDTWLLSLEDERPAALVSFDLQRTRLPAGARVRPVLRVQGGGAGQVRQGGSYASQAGVRVRAWRDGRWVELGRAASSADTPGWVDGPLEAGPLDALLAAGQRLHFAVEPAGVNGAGQARVAVEALELRLEYQLP